MRKAALVLIFVLTGLAVQVTAQCPTIKVIGPAGITNPGDDITFRVELNVTGPKVKYLWSVDKGTITKGQGTPEMTLTTIGLAGEAVLTTVEVDGLPQHCEKTASESAGISPEIECICWDEWDDLKPNEERGRLDLMFAELSNNPTHVALLIFRLKPDEDRLDGRNRRIQFVLRHAKFRKFDKSRIWFGLEISEEQSTRLYRLPSGSELPCEGCLVFKGEHL